MIRLLSLMLLPLSLLAIDDEPTTPAENTATDNVLRIYDFSSLQIGDGMLNREWRDSLLPYIQYNVDDPEEYSEADESGSANALVDLIIELYREEFEYEGRRVSVSNNQQMAVRGPEGLHQRVQNLIRFFESVVNAQAELSVDILTFSPNTTPELTSSIVSLEEAANLIAHARASGTHEAYTLNLRSDRVAMLDLSRDEPVVTDFDAEIAQGAAIQDPIVTMVSTGTRLTARVAPAEDGMFLALTLKRGERIGDTRPDEFGLHFLAGSEKGGLTLMKDASRLSNLQVLARSNSLSTFLPTGKALVLQSRLDVERGSVSEMIVLRHTGGGLPTRHELPLSQDGARVIFADMGALAPPRAIAEGTLLNPTFVPHTLESSRYHVTLTTRLESGDTDFAMEVLNAPQDYASLEMLGPWMLSRPFGSFLGDDSARVKVEQDAILASLEAIRPKGEVYDLAVTVSRAGSKPVSVRVPVRPGCSASMAVGIEGIDAYDYDVEVAQMAAVPDLSTRVTFDGLVLWVRPTPTPGGKLLLEVRGGANLWEKEQHVDIGGLLVDYLDQAMYQHLFVNERLILEEQDGSWSARLGNTNSGLTLEITVRKQR